MAIIWMWGLITLMIPGCLASLGMTPQKRAIERKMGKLYADTTMHTIDFQPMIWVNWKKKEARITFNYSGSNPAPSLSDLMPLTVNSNPLYITREIRI